MVHEELRPGGMLNLFELGIVSATTVSIYSRQRKDSWERGIQSKNFKVCVVETWEVPCETYWWRYYDVSLS